MAHKNKYTKTERRGLPGGPNEVFTYVTGVFSTEGYKSDSPDVNNPFNIIPSGNITMKGVDFPVMGIDNLGNSQIMMPGGEYEFPGDKVFELPMAQDGFFNDIQRGARKLKRSLGDYIEGNQGYIPDILTGGKPTRQALDEVGMGISDAIPAIGREANTLSSYANPKNYNSFLDPIKSYNEYDTFDEAFAAARKDAKGPGGFFLYNGKRYPTKYKGEPGNKETADIFKSLEGEDYLGRLLEVWTEYGGTNISTETDDNNYYILGNTRIPFYNFAKGMFPSSELDIFGEGNRPHLQPLSMGNDIYIRKPYAKFGSPKYKRQLAEAILEEIGHSYQINKEGTASLMGHLFKDEIGARIKGKRTYDTPGTREYDAHEIIEEQLKSYVFDGANDFPRLELGGSLPKAQKGFFDSMKNYLKGEQGYVPDILTGGLPTSTVVNTMKPVLEITPAGKMVKVVDDLLQIASVPSALVAEGVEGIQNQGDQEFNWRDAMPNLNDAFYDPTTMKTVAGVKGVDGLKGFGLNMVTDPLSYVGVGLARGLLSKGATKLIKPVVSSTSGKFSNLDAGYIKDMGLAKKAGVDINNTDFMYGGDLPKAQYGINLLDDLVKAGAKKFSSAFRKSPKLNVTGLDDAVYKTGYKQYDNLTMQQLNDVVSNRKAWINSDEYFTRRFNQLRKSDEYKYLPKDDLTNLIKSNVKSMENAFDDLTVKFSKDVRQNGIYTGDYIGIKTPDGSGVGYSPTLKTYLDVFDHEVMHALQPKSGSWNEKYLESIYKIAKNKIAKGENVDKIKKMLIDKGTSMDEISKGFHRGQGHMTTNLSPKLKDQTMIDGNMFDYLSIPSEQNVRHIQAIENLVKKYGYDYGKVSDDLLKKFADDVVNGNNKFDVDYLFRNLADDSGKAVDVGSKSWNKIVRPILENAWMFPVAGTVAGATEYKEGGSVSWQWKGKTYSGPKIGEDENNIYARTHNGKVKTISKKQQGGSVSEIWQDVTGTPWSQARAQGLTDGSYGANIELRKQLISTPSKFKQKPSNTLPPANTNSNAGNATLSPEEINDKINSANDFSSAFKIARDYYGPNKIFEYNAKQYGTNIKGEEFKPSDQDMELAGLKVDQKENIKLQNELVVSPYSTTDVVQMDEYEDIEDVKQRTNDLNKMSQADLIVNFQNQSNNDKPYVIVDKKAGLMHVYEPGNNPNEPIYSAPVDLGAVMGDAQTVTKYVDINQDGTISQDEISPDNIDWSAGNKMTGAGRYKISNINRAGYMDLPSFNLSNESGQNVGTSFHAGYIDDDNSRVSNGCIRCNQGSLNVLTDYLQQSSEVFILPEDEGNKFVFENGQLNFKAGSKRDDYLEYEDDRGNIQKGQGINRTINTLNYKPIQVSIDDKFKADKFTENSIFGDDEEEYNNTVVPFAKSLQDNKQLVMKNLKVNGDVYNDLAALAFGIFGNETGFGDTHNPAGNIVRGGLKLGSSLYDKAIDNLNLPDSLKLGPRGSVDYKTERFVNEQLSRFGFSDPDDSSMGLTQVRWNQIEKEPALVEALSSVGVTQGRDFDDPAKAALGTVAILAYLRNNREGGNVPIEDLPRLYAGASSTDPNRDAYTKNALDNAKYLNIKQKKQNGGGITPDLLLRQAFAESTFRPDAVSDKDARGIAQFRPITIKEMKRLGIVDDTFDPFDISQAIPAQKAYMAYLSKRPPLIKGDNDEVKLAKILFAYNRGYTGAVKDLTALKEDGVDIYNSTDWVDSINTESGDYIKKIHLRTNDKFNKEFDQALSNEKYNYILNEYKSIGGEISDLKVYKDYMNGLYDNKPNLKKAESVYDKLNRVYYYKAGQVGMSSPNYIMSYLINGSM